MTEKYKYRPPFKYLFVGLGGLLSATIFGLVIGKDEIWLSVIVGLFCLMTLALGIGFLTIYIKKFRMGPLIIGEKFIEIPGRWKKRIRLNLTDILKISEFDGYDNVIEIESQQGIHLIEQNWMNQNDFETVKARLQEYWMNKFPQDEPKH